MSCVDSTDYHQHDSNSPEKSQQQQQQQQQRDIIFGGDSLSGRDIPSVISSHKFSLDKQQPSFHSASMFSPFFQSSSSSSANTYTTFNKSSHDYATLQDYALDLVSDPILFTSENKILFANSSFEKLTGFDRSELIGSTPTTGIPFLDTHTAGLFFAFIRAIVNNTSNNKNETSLDGFDKKHQTFIARVAVHVYRPALSDNVQDIRCICLFNITFGQHTKEATFQTLFDNVKIGMGIMELDKTDHDLIFVANNIFMAEYLQCPGGQEALMSKHMRTDLKFPETSMIKLLNFFKDCEIQKKPVSKCLEIILPSGSNAWLALTINYIGRSMHNNSRFSFSMEDITQRKKVEEELLLAESKTLFLSNMSHELRTPLSAVIGMASVLSETPLNSLQKECIDSIQMCGDSLLNMINDILEFSKMESQQLKFSVEDVELMRLLEHAIEVVSPKAHQKSLEMVLNVEEGTQSMIACDKQRLTQVLINLLSNAIKFTDYGQITLTVSSRIISRDQLLSLNHHDPSPFIPSSAALVSTESSHSLPSLFPSAASSASSSALLSSSSLFHPHQHHNAINNPIMSGDPSSSSSSISSSSSPLLPSPSSRRDSISETVVQKLLDDHERICLFEFAVQDTGIGISDPAKVQLCHPFTVEDHTLTRRYGGAGLGLSICKRLVERMGGKLGSLPRE